MNIKCLFWTFLLGIFTAFAMNVPVPTITTLTMEDIYLQTLVWKKIAKRKWECPICKKGITDKRLHSRSHTGFSPFTCKTCNQAFKQQQGLYRHEETMHENKSVICDVCQQNFSHKSNLTIHKKRMHAPKNMQCPSCSSVFSATISLNKHIKNVHSGNTFACFLCSLTLKSNDSLNRHINNIHAITQPQPKEKNIECPKSTCDKLFATKNDLNHHLKTVHTKKRFKCKRKDCNKKFKTQGDLKRHQNNTHAINYRFSCICGYGPVKWKVSLQRHQKNCSRYKQTINALLN